MAEKLELETDVQNLEIWSHFYMRSGHQSNANYSKRVGSNQILSCGFMQGFLRAISFEILKGSGGEKFADPSPSGLFHSVYNLVLVPLVTTNLYVISHVLNFYWL